VAPPPADPSRSAGPAPAAGRRAAVPGRVALVATHPERHNRRALHMAATLAAAGHRVTLYTETGFERPADLPEAVALVPCLAEGPDGGPDPAGLAAVDLEAADVVHVAGPAALRHVGGRLGPDCRLVYDVPGLDGAAAVAGAPAGTRAWAGELFRSLGERFRAPRIDAVVCPGYVFGQYLQRELKLGRVPVVPIYAAHRLREAVRPTPPACLRPGRPAVAALGADHADLGVALRGMGRLRRGVDLVAVNGTGDWAALEAGAGDVGMAGQVHRVEAGPEALIPTLAAFHAGLVLPVDVAQRALYDLPDALFSFLMAGVPVVASQLPGLERVVGAHNVGLLVEPRDEEQVGDAVARICLDEALRERLLHNLALVREKRYSWEAQEGRLLDLYDRLLAEAPR